jgi:hypothetical protein
MPLSTVASDTVRLGAAAAAAGGAGWLAGGLLGWLPSIVDLCAGGLVVLAAFVGLTRLMGGGWLWRWS